MCASAMLADGGPLLGAREPERRRARHSSTAWSQPARLKTNYDRREHLFVVRARSTSRPGPACASAAPAAVGRGRAAGVEAPPSGLGRPDPSERRKQLSSSRPFPHQVVLMQSTGRRSSMIAPSLRGRSRSSRHLLGVRHRRRQAHQVDAGRQMDDDLLPHRTAIRVLEIVHLVEDDVAEPVKRR